MGGLVFVLYADSVAFGGYPPQVDSDNVLVVLPNVNGMTVNEPTAKH